MAPRFLLHFFHAGSLGHQQRTLTLARALRREEPRATVVVVAGGVPLPPPSTDEGIAWVQLPALTTQPSPGFRVDPHALDLETAEVLALRRDMLLALADHLRPDVLITEMFPFGRPYLEPELRPLFERLGSGCRVVASMRDVLGHPPGVWNPAVAGHVAALLEEHYDAVLVHGDPTLLRLEDSLDPAPAGLVERLVYTGYVGRAPLASEPQAAGEGPRTVLVSAGGGQDGLPLLELALEAEVSLNADEAAWRVELVAGPLLPEEAWSSLEERAARRPMISLQRTEPRLPQRMAAVEVCVSMAGYNSVVELLRARARAVLVPRAQPEPEQIMRARTLAERGWVSWLPPGGRTGSALADLIRARATAGRPRSELRVDGAEVSAQFLLGLVG
jgi:predicted glycosyltransferase